jgi:hypothetical protein
MSRACLTSCALPRAGARPHAAPAVGHAGAWRGAAPSGQRVPPGRRRGGLPPVFARPAHWQDGAGRARAGAHPRGRRRRHRRGQRRAGRAGRADRQLGSGAGCQALGAAGALRPRRRRARRRQHRAGGHGALRHRLRGRGGRAAGGRGAAGPAPAGRDDQLWRRAGRRGVRRADGRQSARRVCAQAGVRRAHAGRRGRAAAGAAAALLLGGLAVWRPRAGQLRGGQRGAGGMGVRGGGSGPAWGGHPVGRLGRGDGC